MQYCNMQIRPDRHNLPVQTFTNKKSSEYCKAQHIYNQESIKKHNESKCKRFSNNIDYQTRLLSS